MKTKSVAFVSEESNGEEFVFIPFQDYEYVGSTLRNIIFRKRNTKENFGGGNLNLSKDIRLCKDREE